MTNKNLNQKEKTSIDEVLGYLNFSSGSFDVGFLSAWNDIYCFLSQNGATELWRDALDLLKEELDVIANENEAFSDSRQARRALDLIEKVLPEYRNFHVDTLFRIPDSYLFNSFFMARLASLSTSFVAINEDEDFSVDDLILQLNDFLGYRPIPVLEGEEHEPNPHEWVAPLPIYYEGAGVAFGKYHNVVEQTLNILKDTDPEILLAASFDSKYLRELVVDPRAYDFDHPVNRRLNYSFGFWDDRSIDKNGYYRRFVLHRAMLDMIMKRVVEETDDQIRKEYEYEAAAVLAGTMLMGSAVSGGRAMAHDSNITLVALAPVISSFRDRFYEQLLVRTPEPLKSRLLAESKKLYQPFAGVRQALNQDMAKKRADQLQRFSLSRTYARMGYFEASKRQADIIETTSSRLLSRIDSYLTESHLIADSGKIKEAAELLPKIEDLLRRGLACGAFPDPWFIIGFDAQFSLYYAIEDSVHDHRIDDLIDLLNDIFDLYSRLQKEAAARGDVELRLELSDKMSDLASWWDQFGSTESSSVEGFSGQEAWESAAKVSTALAAWSQAGGAIGDVSFWKRHVERFKSPKAFVLLCGALLDKNDLISSMSLMVYWLSKSDSIPLIEGDYSFHSIARYWMEQAWRLDDSEQQTSSSIRRRGSQGDCKRWKKEEYLKRWNAACSFLDRVEANAEIFWETPRLQISDDKFERKIVIKTDNPVLAELTKRLILSAKYVGKTKSGIPKIVLKGGFRDVARSVDARCLPEPREFEPFYLANKKAFPKYLTFPIFMQIVLGEVRMSPERRALYRREIFGSPGDVSLSVSNPDYKSKPSNIDNFLDDDVSNLTAVEENRLSQKKLWEAMLNELGGEKEIDNLGELLWRVLDEDEEEDKNVTEETPQDPSSVAIQHFDEDLEDEFDEEDLDDDFSEDDEESTITGGDPTFSAAYENMSYHDSADDGTDDDVAGGNSSFKGEGEGLELAREMDRVSEHLTFIYTIVDLWKFVTGRSPLSESIVDKPLEASLCEDARLHIEGWLKQAKVFEGQLYELLDQASRYRIPKPSGTAESLGEFDQLRGSKEILLDRIVWTLVEVEDSILFLKATLRDETLGKYEKSWKLNALKASSAIFYHDVDSLRKLWSTLIKSFERETLLYIPTARGGDAKDIVEKRYLQQVVLRLLKYAPRMGLLRETFELIDCAQKMESIHLSAPGSITEYDRLIEITSRSMTESLVESSKYWRARPNAKVRKFESNSEALVTYLSEVMDVVLKFWLSHSQHIRISAVEAMTHSSQWEAVVNLIKTYGRDLFTQQFLAFRNIRAILHQGVSIYLSSLIDMKNEGEDLEWGDDLISALISGEEQLEIVTPILEVILESIAENYSEYADYNATTTQSDRGDRLYTFLDFLRTLVNYERISWNLKPVYWIHDSLIRSGQLSVAELWKKNVKEKSDVLAENILQEYSALNKKYGILLPSIRERLYERFVRPLEIAQMRGLVFDSISEVRKNGEDNLVFKELEKAIETFAAEPGGGGYELPEWLNDLQEEVVMSRVDTKEERRERDNKNDDPFDNVYFCPIERMTQTEVEKQIRFIFNVVNGWRGR